MIRSEAALQAALHDTMHRPESGRCCWKVQDRYRKGLPDCCVSDGGRAAWVELKHVYPRNEDRAGLFLTGLDPEQRVHLREWARAGGRAFLLLSHHSGGLCLVPALALPPTRERVSLQRLREISLAWTSCSSRSHVEWLALVATDPRQLCREAGVPHTQTGLPSDPSPPK